MSKTKQELTNLLGRTAKEYVTQTLGINPAVWKLTQDNAWLNLAARLATRNLAQQK